MFANCAAMHIPPNVARDMTLWEYEATLVQWNNAHETDHDPEPASEEQVRATYAYFEAHPELLN
jgi:hypothetical protein